MSRFAELLIIGSAINELSVNLLQYTVTALFVFVFYSCVFVHCCFCPAYFFLTLGITRDTISAGDNFCKHTYMANKSVSDSEFNVKKT